MKQKTAIQEFLKGLWDENPVLVSLLGLCPTLAVTVSAINGLAMGLAATFVLLCSAFLVSLLRKVIPNQVRIAAYIVIIATFVTIADRFLAAFTPDISKALGPFIPLIIVNCIILGRMEAFASKNGIGRSLLDALGMGAGFTLTLLVLSSIREILGSGTWFGLQLMWPFYAAWKVMVLPPGAFLTLGCMIAAANWINTRRRS
ncbi:MAG: electron transport complex subunit E [Candidatus Neomarinimicrobiota bacterium]|jgi:electron transport complex protein RnfE|nr:electron transport complex subunit E [Candidatus Neomarinimicrobiota bacterium]MDD3966723.1 electron transport complex subunit E [Candidatus Neomarinimicrobiota bacterium]MDX9780483.1 electron transport complex subunit E [bacterium]